MDNRGLVNHAKKALSEKWGYVWGTFGQVLTKRTLKKKAKQYPEEVGKYIEFINRNWIGRRTSDCSGLIKSYYWGGKYKSATDVSPDVMYSNARERGVIFIIPEIEGLCVWMPGHVGVYIGNGRVIEARGYNNGVIEAPLTGEGSAAWTHWFKCPYIDYIEPDRNNTPRYPGHLLKFKLSVRDKSVLTLKERLKKLGYFNSKINSIFGTGTLAAVRRFQRARGLEVDGVVGMITWKELFY